MRVKAIPLAFLALVVIMAGCGGGNKSGLAPREQGMESTYQGSYQVKGTEEGLVRGVGVYSDGSFRVLVEDVPRVIIHNQESGENWDINLALKEYESISYDEALLKAGFMPHLSMKGYFELEQFWTGTEFRMDTTDGRSIRAFLDGPEYLPTLWEAELRGEVFSSTSWEYSRVDHVSPDNFELPEGLTPTGQSQT